MMDYIYPETWRRRRSHVYEMQGETSSQPQGGVPPWLKERKETLRTRLGQREQWDDEKGGRRGTWRNRWEVVTQGLTVSGKKFRFYSKCNGKPLKGFQQEKNLIRLKFLEDHCQEVL